MSALVLTQHRDHLIEIILNRPEKRNAINWQMMTELDAAITDVEKLSGVRAILVSLPERPSRHTPISQKAATAEGTLPDRSPSKK